MARPWCAFVAALASAACGADGGTTTNLPSTPVTLAISQVQVAGQASVTSGDAGCFELLSDASETLLVTTEASSNWIYRPVDACGFAVRCGAVKLTVTTEASPAEPSVVYSAVPVVSVELQSLGLDLTQGTEVTLQALLVDDQLRPFLDPGSAAAAGASCAEREGCDELRLTFAESCD